MISGPKQPADEMIPQMVETAKTHPFIFMWQERDGHFHAMSNLKPSDLIPKFINDAPEDIQDPKENN